MRRWVAALWALAVLLPFLTVLPGPYGSDLLIEALAVAAVGALPRPWIWRGAILALVFGTGLGLGGAPLVPSFRALAGALAHGRWEALTQAQGTLLFEIAAPLVMTVFELRSDLVVRLLELVVGCAVLALAGDSGVSVKPYLFAFFALFFPLRHVDLLPSDPVRLGGAAYGAVLGGLLFVALSLTPVTRYAVSVGGAGSASLPLDVAQLDTPISQSPDTIFWVKTTYPTYWRVFSSDFYTGQGWSHTVDLVSVSADFHLGDPYLKGDAKQVTATFRMASALKEDPYPGSLVRLVGRGPWTFDLENDAIATTAPTYTVQAVLPYTDPSLLLQAGPETTPPIGDLQVPPALAAKLQPVVSQILSGVPANTYDQVQAIVAYLHRHERYALDNPADGGRDFVTAFLFGSHRGNCTAFASAFALMARTAGIPVRFVVGYTTGTPAAGGFNVSGKDAHAWDEVAYQAIGWIPVDPTPGFAVPSPTKPAAPGGVTKPVPTPGHAIPKVKAPFPGRAHPHLPPTGAGEGVRIHHPQEPPPWAAAGFVALVVGAAVLVRVLVSPRHPSAIRVAAAVAGRPWRYGVTVRAWLGGEAPVFLDAVERRIYGVGDPQAKSGREGLRELGSFLARGGIAGRLVGLVVRFGRPS